jgi:acyl dehydratase
MPIRSAAVGLLTEPLVREVTTRHLLAYAAGIGDTNQRLFDDASAAGIVAHPAFCTALEWPAALAIRRHPALQVPRAEALRGVHAEQDSTFHRPIRPGDRLRTTAKVIQIRHIHPGALVVTRYDTSDAATGAPVVTSYMSTIYRGVPVEGPEAQSDDVPALPLPPAPLSWSPPVTMPIAREAPHVYTECAQIWNPIHTERRVALEAGLPDIILHGTATWAMAASQLIRRCAGGDPTRLRRLAGRFTAMVLPGSTITLQYGVAPGAELAVPYTVCNASGDAAITRGLALIAQAD